MAPKSYLKKVGALSSLLLLPACSLFFPTKTELDIKERIMTIDDIKSVFPTSSEQITHLADNALARVKKGLEAIYAIPDDQRTFDNTARALDTIGLNFGKAGSIIGSMGMLHPDKAIRDEAHKQEVRLDQEAVDLLSQNKKLYDAFKSYAEGKAKKENLKPHEHYFIEEEMKGFKQAGLDLPEDKREKVKVLKKELSTLTTEFEKNINEDKSSTSVTADELTGMPEEFIASLQKDEKGKLILGTDYPTYFNIMKNCSNADVRKRLFMAFQNRAYPQNLELLNKIINLRDQLAHVLGYKSYADLDIEMAMALSPENVDQFLTNLMQKAVSKGALEMDRLKKDLPEGVTLSKEGTINPWDSSYIIEKYKQKNYDLSDEKMAEYFPIDSTIEALFSIYEKFFGIELSVLPLQGLWHDNLQLVEVKKDGKLLSYIILDLYPRDNKFSHACKVGIYPPLKLADGTLSPALNIIIANFPKATKDKPALLKYSDVSTFFHEFGHALHSTLGATELSSQAGTHVKPDFVELPSQILEEWLYDPEILKMVSKHYKTGEPLPDDMIEKKIALKNLVSGDFVLGQGIYAKMSLDYHKAGENKDTTTIKNALSKQYRPYITYVPGTHSQVSFGHLVNGLYSSKYYGYLWSKVFALDVFDAIKKTGLLNPEIGEKYSREIIAKGGSQDPNELLENFLGRKPNQEAFLKDLGLK